MSVRSPNETDSLCIAYHEVLGERLTGEEIHLSKGKVLLVKQKVT